MCTLIPEEDKEMWTMTSSFGEVSKHVWYDISQLFYGFHWKLLFSLPTAWLANYLHIDLIIFWIWLAFMCLDLILGITRSVKDKNFKPKYVSRWFLKFGTHIFIILVSATAIYVLSRLFDNTIPAINFVIASLLFTELSSIIDNLKKIGLPVPPLIIYINGKMRRKTINKLTTFFAEKPVTDEEIDNLLKGEEMPFDEVYHDITAKFEGGYANVSGDAGGETIYGISRVSFPQWEGWPLVDEAKATVGKSAVAINRHFASDANMRKLVEDFYKKNFWETTK
jgi:phage-related holin